MKSPQRKLRAFFCLKSPNSSSFGVASPVSCTRHGVLVLRVCLGMEFLQLSGI